MMRDPLYVGNFTVAGAAFLRGMRQKRVMRIMAPHARFAGIMKLCDNLWESGRS